MPSPASRQPGLSLLGLASLSLCGVLVLAWGGTPGASVQQQLLAVLAATLLGGLALCWLACQPAFDRCTLASIFGLALLLRAVASTASPLLEDDHYRYLWDGLRTLQGLDPYRLPPAVFFPGDGLSPRWQDVLSGINNPDIPTLYGPLLQALFALAQLITPGRLGGLQTLLLGIDMAVLATLAVQGLKRRWLLLYAVHPLVLREALASAHPDGLLGLLLLWALLAWRQQWPWRLGLLLGLAAATKAAAWVAVPLLLLAPGAPALCSRASLNWVRRVLLALLGCLVLLYAPFVARGGSDLAALGTFGRDWRFNPLLFRLPDAFLPAPWNRFAAAGLLLAALLCLARWWQHKVRVAHPVPIADPRASPPVHTALVALLLLAPVVNPWYWLWALPLSLLAGQRQVAVVGVLAVLSYVNSSVLVEAGWADVGLTGLTGLTGQAPYSVPWAFALLQVSALAWAVWRDSASLAR